MLQTIKRFFNDELQQEDGHHHSLHKLQTAAAALLFEVSQIDYDSDSMEQEAIAQAIQHQFQLDDAETETLMKLAEQEAQDATSLYGFVSLVNEHWSIEERTELVEFMWRVAYADDTLDDHEVHLMRKVARLLHIPHKKFIGAKLRAKEK